MKSIYEVVDRESGELLPPRPRAPMPEQLTQIGCGRHQFELGVSGTFHCTNPGCPTKIRPGMLLYSGLHAWMTGHGAAG